MTGYEAFLSKAAAGMKESAIRRMGTVLAANRDVISFAPGYPAPETFPSGDLQNIAHELLSGADPHVLQYGATRGFRPLLEVIAGIMQHRGAPTSLDRLLVTTGSQQGLDLVARVLLDPGDVVLVELPTYTGAITAFRNVQAHMAGVEQEADGISLAALDAVHARMVSARRRVRLLYLVPNFQNPTGLLIGLDKRRALLEWAARHDILIVEDDPYRDLYFEDSATERDVRPMKADDGDGRVVYLSSFSKTLAPGYRVAWIDAPAALTAKFEFAKQAADLCTGTLDQRIVYEVVRQGILDRQLPMLRAHYREKRDVMVTALRDGLGEHVAWAEPRGGFFLWVRLPEIVDANRLIERAVRHGVVFVAGEAFFVEPDGTAPELATPGGGRNLVRLSFSAPTPARIREGVVRLRAALREEIAELSEPGAVAREAR
jgi:2-aminoadipate transaminase